MKVEELQQELEALAGPVPDAPDGGLSDVRRIARRQRRVRAAVASGAFVALVVVAVTIVSGDNRSDPPHVVSPADTTTSTPSTAPNGDAIDIGLGTVQQIDAGPLAARWGAIAVPAGSGVFVWGGHREAENMGLPGPSIAYSDGAYYDPAAQTWTEVPAAPFGTAPAATRSVGTVVGDVVYVASGRATAAWHLDTRQWTTLAVAPEDLAALVDAGGRVFGVGASGNAYELRDTGWRDLPALPVQLSNQRAVWTGHELVILGKREFVEISGHPISGVTFDPSRDSWRAIPDVQLSAFSFDAAWDGNSIVVVDDNNGASRYAPASDSWTSLPGLAPSSSESSPFLTIVNGHVAALLAGKVAVLDANGWSIGESWPNRPCCGIAAVDGAVYLFGYAGGANQFFVWRPRS